MSDASVYKIVISSPLGSMILSESNGAIIGLDWRIERPTAPTALLDRAAKQIEEYFARQRRDFDLPLAPRGSDFQQRVWRRMAKIPYGHVLTYGDLAKDVKSAARAIGGACGRNPIAIILPCHRVIGDSGALTGYSGAGGVSTKQYLLELEGAVTRHGLDATRLSA